MFKEKVSYGAMVILVLMTFSFINCSAQNSNFEGELKINVRDNIVSLKWNARNMENVEAFNIYRTEISNESKDSNLSDMDFMNIGATKEFSFVDKLKMIKPGSTKSFYYYVSAVDNDGKEIGQTNLSKVTVSAVDSISANYHSQL